MNRKRRVVFYTALIGCIEKGLLKAGQRTGWTANGVRTAGWKKSTHMMLASFCERGLYLSAFPDHRLVVSHQIAEGDFVLTHWSVTGTQESDLPGVPATHRSMDVSGMTLSRVANGKISEEWQNWDSQGLLEQLGFELIVPDIEFDKDLRAA